MKTYRVLVVLIMFASSLLLNGLGFDDEDSPLTYVMEPAFADSSEDEWDEPVVTPPHPYPGPPVANCEILEDPDDLWTYIPINFSSNGSYCRPGLYEGWYITFSWDFGDGTELSTMANPVHVYEEPGTFNVILTVTDHPNKDTAHDNIVLTVIYQNNETVPDTLVIINQPNYDDC
ncbi:MAG: PKD domain-containing protein, partial [Candidatus Thermoplasmatota archaeon]|nr:PKD domain-containing protein [Candidatus Thermoplasmatota archaeon]